jgi:hypothetical protein
VKEDAGWNDDEGGGADGWKEYWGMKVPGLYIGGEGSMARMGPGRRLGRPGP